jgi:hypothetical protein
MAGGAREAPAIYPLKHDFQARIIGFFTLILAAFCVFLKLFSCPKGANFTTSERGAAKHAMIEKSGDVKFGARQA